MLCCALMCVSAGHWVIMCVRLWVLVATVCADFVDEIIYSLSVSCQSSVMSTTKKAASLLLLMFSHCCCGTVAAAVNY